MTKRGYYYKSLLRFWRRNDRWGVIMACLVAISLFICDVALAKKCIMLSYYFRLDSLWIINFWGQNRRGWVIIIFVDCCDHQRTTSEPFHSLSAWLPVSYPLPTQTCKWAFQGELIYIVSSFCFTPKRTWRTVFEKSLPLHLIASIFLFTLVDWVWGSEGQGRGYWCTFDEADTKSLCIN